MKNTCTEPPCGVKRSRSAARKKFSKAPKGEQFFPEPRAMLESAAYDALGITELRILRALKIEHMRGAGLRNGELICPYDDLEAKGCSRPLIKKALANLEALGFLRPGVPLPPSGRHKPPSTYRLTFVHTTREGGAGPTNEWKEFDGKPELVQKRLNQVRAKRAAAKELRRKVAGKPPAKPKKSTKKSADFVFSPENEAPATLNGSHSKLESAEDKKEGSDLNGKARARGRPRSPALKGAASGPPAQAAPRKVGEVGI